MTKKQLEEQVKMLKEIIDLKDQVIKHLLNQNSANVTYTTPFTSGYIQTVPISTQDPIYHQEQRLKAQ